LDSHCSFSSHPSSSIVACSINNHASYASSKHRGRAEPRGGSSSVMAPAFLASQRACNPAAGVVGRGGKSVLHFAHPRPLPPAARGSSTTARDSRTAADSGIGWAGPGCVQAVRGALQIAHGVSKASLYTQLPDRLDEPTPGFDSIAHALEDLAAGVLSLFHR
jgi:hypothetical protein